MLLLCLCSGKQELGPEYVDKVKPEIIKTVPHDSTAFTQGLLYQDGKLYESTGIVGQSTIRIVDTSGTVKTKKYLREIFAEGCAFFDGLLYQISWTEQTCIIYNADLVVLNTISYDGEGWGLTADSNSLIMSNGSDTLYFRDKNFKIIRKLPVTLEGKPLKNLNELEYANGKILANVWFSDFIYEISPQTGAVSKIIDCTELVDIEKPVSDNNVLNGIAFLPMENRFFLTGKNWKNMFLVKIP
jgi:glutamine cyclotransferase